MFPIASLVDVPTAAEINGTDFIRYNHIKCCERLHHQDHPNDLYLQNCVQ